MTRITAALLLTAFILISVDTHTADDPTKIELTKDNKGWLAEGKRVTTSIIKATPPGIAFVYTYLMSIACAHELSHAAVSVITGNKTSIHISPWYNGNHHIWSSCPKNTINHMFICLAGPLGGIAASFAWSPMLKVILQFSTANNTEKEEWEALFEKRFAMALSFSGAVNEWWRNFVPGYCKSGDPNDGLQIQRSLSVLAPSLAKVYPFIIYAGFAGLVSYGVYGLYATTKAKLKADK